MPLRLPAALTSVGTVAARERRHTVHAASQAAVACIFFRNAVVVPRRQPLPERWHRAGCGRWIAH